VSALPAVACIVGDYRGDMRLRVVASKAEWPSRPPPPPLLSGGGEVHSVGDGSTTATRSGGVVVGSQACIGGGSGAGVQWRRWRIMSWMTEG
jgi:hypothetical protein